MLMQIITISLHRVSPKTVGEFQRNDISKSTAIRLKYPISKYSSISINQVILTQFSELSLNMLRELSSKTFTIIKNEPYNPNSFSQQKPRIRLLYYQYRVLFLGYCAGNIHTYIVLHILLRSHERRCQAVSRIGVWLTSEIRYDIEIRWFKHTLAVQLHLHII